MPISFSLLALAICAVWLPPLRIGARSPIPIWPLPLIGAIAAGLLAGYLSWSAIAELGVFAIAAWCAGRAEASRWKRILYGSITAVMALALALHKLPGFNNPVLIAAIKFTTDAKAFTLFANFDKAAVGLILLAFLCKRAGSALEWQEILRRTAPIALLTSAATIAVALAIGLVRLDLKLPPFTPLFLVTNLLFTCVAEEAFFRGFLQERLARLLDRFRFGGHAAILCSAVLFGLAHAAGGARYALLATITGLGCAYAYSIVRRIEAPIITHFMLNAVHFVGFTYPQLQ